MAAELMKDIAVAIADKDQANRAEWRLLVARIADGEEAAAQEVAAQLARLGKNLQQLEADVSLRRRRLAAAEKVQAGAPAASEVGRLGAAIDALVEERRGAEASFAQRHAALAEQMNAASAVVSAADTAASFLRQTIDPALRDRIAQIGSKSCQLGEVAAGLSKHLVMLNQQAADNKQSSRRHSEKEDAGAAAEFARQIKATRERLEVLRKQQADLAAEREELEDESLKY